MRVEKLLVVTDLDATLLDSNYQWKEAIAVVERLYDLGFPLVFNSSKTIAEMRDLSEEMKNISPMVAENGGAVAIPKNSATETDPRIADRPAYEVSVNGISRAEICKIAHELRERENFSFEGFSDWTVAELQERTGLTLSQAENAREREATEPIIWLDKEDRWSLFEQELSNHGIRILRGGRFRHLMGEHDKADGLRLVRDLYVKAEPETKWTTVALGDSQNDIKMLEAADIAVVIPSLHGTVLEPKTAQVVVAQHLGPKGWSTSMNEIIDDTLRTLS